MSITKEKEKLIKLKKDIQECEERIVYKEKRQSAIDKKMNIYYDWYINGGINGVKKFGIWKALSFFNEHFEQTISMAEFRSIVNYCDDKLMRSKK
jgi:hypothetical protein